MTNKTVDEKVTIDGKEYSLGQLTENARVQIANIQFVDTQLQQLNNEWRSGHCQDCLFKGSQRRAIVA